MSLLKRMQPPGTGLVPTSPPSSFPPPRPPSPFANFGARPNQRVSWEFLPLTDTIVFFDINGIAESVYALAGLPMPTMPSETEAPKPEKTANGDGGTGGTSIKPIGSSVTAVGGLPTRPLPGSPLKPPPPPPPPTLAQMFADLLEKHPEVEEALKDKLDAAWAAMPLTGAALIYGWRPEVKQAVIARLEALQQPMVIYRATDPTLVLNVLSRARTHVLIGNAPPALERGFLERQLYADDPRLVAMVKATGAVEIVLVEPPPPEEDLVDET